MNLIWLQSICLSVRSCSLREVFRKQDHARPMFIHLIRWLAEYPTDMDSIPLDSTFPLLQLFLAWFFAFYENSTRDGAAVDKAWKKFDGFDRWALPTAKVGPKFAKSSMTERWNPRWQCFHNTTELDLWNVVFNPSCLKGVVKGRTRTDWSHFCQVCQVGWSGPHQGFQAHVERYRNSPVMHKSTFAFSWVPSFLFSLLGAKNLRHQDVCHVSGGRLKITWFSAWFGRTCCDPEVCQTVTSPWSSRMAFASLSLAQPRKSKPLWHRFGRKRMCNDVIHSGH